MTKNEIQKLREELEAMSVKRNAAKKENAVGSDDFPKISRTFTYRKSTIIQAHDLAI